MQPREDEKLLIEQRKLLATICLSILIDKTKINENVINNLILEGKIKVNATTNAGYPLIYYAAKQGMYSLVNKLILNGAKLNDKYDGLTLRDIVKQQLAIALQKKDSKSASEYENIDRLLETNGITINQKSLDEFSNRVNSVENRMQAWIKYPLKVMGYEHQSEGYCNGVAHMGLQAILLEERDKNNNLIHLAHFKERTDRMRQIPYDNFLDTVDTVEHKRILLLELAKHELKLAKLERNQKELQLLELKGEQGWLEDKINSYLTNINKVDLEIHPFLDDIELFQQICKHNELLKKSDKTEVQNALPVIPIVATPALEKQGGMVVVDHFSGVYDDKELLDLLTALRTQVKKNNYQAPLAIQFSANRHAISIGFDPIKSEWILIDANGSDQTRETKSSVAFFKTEEEIKNTIMNNLFANQSKDKLLLETNIFATAAQCKDLKEKVTDPLRKTKEWKNMHAVTQAKIEYKNKDGDDWRDAASHNGDKDILKKIDKFINNKKSFFTRHKGAFIISGIVLASAAVIAGTILSGGLVGVATVAAASAVAIGLAAATGGVSVVSFGGAKIIDKILEGEEHVNKIYAAKAKSLKKGLKKNRKLRKSKYPPKNTTAQLVQELQLPKKLLVINNEPKPPAPPPNTQATDILKKAFTSLDSTEKDKFHQALFKLTTLDEQIEVLLKFQLQRDLEALSGDECNYLPSKVLNICKLIAMPYNKIADAKQREDFREAYFKLPDEIKHQVLEKFQNQAAIARLIQSFESWEKPFPRHITSNLELAKKHLPSVQSQESQNVEHALSRFNRQN